MRLIDADALPEHKFPENQCNKFGDGAYYRQGWNDAIDAIVDNEPTVDAVPVRHGKWVDDSNGIEGAWNYCSVCGEQAIDLYDYCPNCGARMDGDGNG